MTEKFHPIVYRVNIPFPPEAEVQSTCACGFKTTMGQPSLPQLAEHLRSHQLHAVEVWAGPTMLTSGTAQAVAEFLDSVWNAAVQSLLTTMQENIEAGEAELEQADEDSGS